jgi:hypothetical protein
MIPALIILACLVVLVSIDSADPLETTVAETCD